MKKRVWFVKLALVALACATLMGCSQGEPERVRVARLQSFLQRERTQVCGIEYRVMPPDVIAISSNYVREIGNVVQQIRPDGKVSLPLVGEIFVAGLTPQEIRQEVETAARRYYKKSDITVYVVEYKSQKIYVFGEVARPGTMAWTGSNTLLDVLARTQPTSLAWPEKIKVIRARRPARGGYLPEEAVLNKCVSDEEVVITNKNGAEELTVDLTAMVKSGDMSHNILLQPDDVIFVPPNPFAAVGLALQQVLFPVNQVTDLAEAPEDLDNSYLHWKYRSRYYNVVERD